MLESGETGLQIQHKLKKVSFTRQYFYTVLNHSTNPANDKVCTFPSREVPIERNAKLYEQQVCKKNKHIL